MLIEQNLYFYNCKPWNKFFRVMWLFIFLMQLISLAIIDETAFCLPLVSFQKTLIVRIFLNFVQHNLWKTFMESHSHFLNYLSTVKLSNKELLIRSKLVLRNHFLWQKANLLHKDKEHLALRNNFRVTKKFLINNFDCIRNWLFDLLDILKLSYY